MHVNFTIILPGSVAVNVTQFSNNWLVFCHVAKGSCGMKNLK